MGHKTRRATKTAYGTFSISSADGTSTNLEYNSNAMEHNKSGVGSSMPWHLMFKFGSIGLPKSLAETLLRLRFNLASFCVNYAIIVLLVLFCLLWHPISLVVYIVMMLPWLFLCFLRDEPLLLLGHAIDERLMLGVLTASYLFLTNATLNIVVALLIGVVLVALHAVLRKTDYLRWDEEAIGWENSTTTTD